MTLFAYEQWNQIKHLHNKQCIYWGISFLHEAFFMLFSLQKLPEWTFQLMVQILASQNLWKFDTLSCLACRHLSVLCCSGIFIIILKLFCR